MNISRAYASEQKRGDTSRTSAVCMLFLLLIIIIQMAVSLFWVTKRENYFNDELYSLGYAQSYTFEPKKQGYIYRSPEWEYETWIENRILKDQLEVSEQESLLSQPPLTGIKMLLTRRNYHGILNILMSVFSPDRISMYPGAVFNIILLFFTQLLVFRISREITGRDIPSILAVLMYGFSTMAVNMTLYIRFYALVILFLVAAVRLHQIMWRTDHFWRSEMLTIVSMALLYLAMKNSELAFVFGGALIFSYLLGLLARKQGRKALCYMLTVAPAGLLFVGRKPYYLTILLHPENYTEKGWPINVMANSVLNVNAQMLLDNTNKYLNWFVDDLLGDRIVFYGFLGILLLMFDILLFKQVRKPKAAQPEKRGERGFNRVIAGVVVIYFLFALLTSFPAKRYMSFLFPLITILLWSAVSYLTENGKAGKLALLACAALTLYGVLSQQVFNRHISYIYPDDKTAIQAVEDSGVEDAILIFTDVFTGEHTIYDCISIMPDSARIYPVDRENNAIDPDTCPDQMLIWIKDGVDIGHYVEELKTGDYEIKRIGSTHISDIYRAKRISELEDSE